jgi:uncharacterized protein (DUF488 family)
MSDQPYKMIYTIGHSTRSAQELIALLREAGVDLLVDVRTAPRSRFTGHSTLTCSSTPSRRLERT